MNIQSAKTQPHGEQEEVKLAAAKELLQQTNQGKNLGTTENISKGLSQVEQKLSEEARNAPDLKSAQAVGDIANLVDATQKLVLDKDLPDRFSAIAEEARLAAKEQDVNKEKLKDASRTAQRQLGRPPVEVLQDNVLPLLRYVLFSRKFRVLVLDLISIFRKIILRSVSADEEGVEFKEQMKEEWKSGAAPSEMARQVKDRVSENTQNDKGEFEVPVKDEEIDRLIDDIADVITLISSDPKYQDAVQRLFDMGEMAYSQVQEATQDISTNMPHTQKLKQDTKDLVADVSGREPLDRFLDRLNTLSRRLRDDQDARNYLQEFKEFLIAKHPESDNPEFYKSKIRDLIERGRQIFDKWNNSNEVEDFLNASNDFIDSMKNNEHLSKLQETAGILMDDFTYTDAQGKTVLDTNLLSNVQRVIVPVLAEALKYIPIPMIEYHDATMDFTAKDIVLCGYDIIPEKFTMHMESDASVSFKELETQKFRTKFILTVQGIRTEIKDINFTFHRKVFPELTDSGLVSVRMTGNGANLKVWFHVEQGLTDSTPKIESGGMDFDVNSIALDFNRATIKHDILLPMMTGIFKKQIVRAIEQSVENNLQPILNTVRSQLSENNPLVSKFTTNLENARTYVKTGDVSRTFQERQEKLKHT